jgi:hypothetical protein
MSQLTRTDRLIHALRDHPLGAAVIIAAAAAIGLAQVTGAVSQVGNFFWSQRVAMKTTYSRLAHDLQALDTRLEGLFAIAPPIHKVSMQDSVQLIFVLGQAAAAARKVCDYEQELGGYNDSLGVHWVRRGCGFADLVRGHDSLNALYPGVRDRKALLIEQAAGQGLRAMLRQSAEPLRRGAWRP